MKGRSKQEKEELQKLIARIEMYASEHDSILSKPSDYQKVLFQMLQEEGTIPKGVTYARAADKHSLTYMPIIHTVYYSIRHIKKKEMQLPRPRGTARYKTHHVRLGTRETTVSIHPVLEIMLSLHLDTQPGTPPARKAVREWLQHRLDQHGDPGRIAVSHWLQGAVVEVLVSSDLKRKYDEWLLEE